MAEEAQSIIGQRDMMCKATRRNPVFWILLIAIGLVAVVPLLSQLILKSGKSRKEAESAVRNDLHTIRLAVLAFADQNEGSLPASLDQVCKKPDIDQSNCKRWCKTYVYLASGRRVDEDADFPIVAEDMKASIFDEVVYLVTRDGQIELVASDKLKQKK